jgi:CubicO group peptidase (beta-lactamase class C family)
LNGVFFQHFAYSFNVFACIRLAPTAKLERIATMFNLHRLEQSIEIQMRETYVPGLALAIIQEKDLIYARGFGVTSVEDSGLPVTPQTIFRIGSTTKPLTGTAIMRLVEAGKLDLDEPITTYIDWFTLEDKGVASRITLRMLLSHSAGFPPSAEHFGRRDLEGLEAFVREQAMQYQLVSPPGTSLTYSNPGIALVGYIAEVVSGKSYTKLMQELVFEPLQMKRTTFDTTVAMTYPLAQAHDLSKDKILKTQHRFADNVAGYPAGFAMSTVLDLANFAIMQLNQGNFQGQQILSPESVRLMHTIQADLYTIKGTGYGITFFTEQYKGVRLVWHDGGISTYVCKFVLVPESGIAIIMLFNRVGLHYEEIASSILDQLLALPEKEPTPLAVEPARDLWSRYTGNYVGRWVGWASISVVEGQLMLNLNGEPIPLQSMSENLYFGHKADSQAIVSVGFVPEKEGFTHFIYIDTFILARCETPIPAQVDASAWERYAGTYSLEGFDTFVVRFENENLFIYSEEMDEEMVCTPINETRYCTKVGAFDFYIDRDSAHAYALEYGELRKFLRVSETEQQ